MLENTNRGAFEFFLSFFLISTFSLITAFLGIFSLKLLIGFVLALGVALLLILTPARRTLFLCLWLIIQPLGIEKILYTSAPLMEGLRGSEIIINAGDLILLLLASVLLYERFILQKKVFVWDVFNKTLLVIFIWGCFSFLFHKLFLHSEFIQTGPYGLLHLFRNFLFAFIAGSAIQTRKDLLWILVTVAFMILFESILVGISFAIGEPMNFVKLLGLDLKSQEYVVDGQLIKRAAGTLGVPNQQATYHALFTFICVGLLAVKNILFRALGLIAILLSLVAVIFTFSRSAWLAMALASLLICGIFMFRRKITPAGWLIGSILVIGLTVVLAVLSKPILDRLTKGDDGATGSRVRMIKLASDLIQKHPILGVGPGAHVEAGLYYYPPGEKEVEWVALGEKAIVPPLGRVELAMLIVPGRKPLGIPLSVHNKYLLVFSELGILGLLLWVSLYYYVFRSSQRLGRSNDQLMSFISVTGYALVLISFIYMMLDLFYDDRALQVLLFPMVLILAAEKVMLTNLAKVA